MAHNVETMFTVGKKPWHGLGHVLTEAPKIDEAIIYAGLDWRVEKHPMGVYKVESNEAGEPVGIVTHDFSKTATHGLIRSDNSQYLAKCSPSYEPVQNESAFKWFQPFLDEGHCELESAGSLRKGELVWVLAKIKDGTREVVAGDPVESYILLSNSHKPGRSLCAGFTPIRVVCNNTLNMAINDDDERSQKTLARLVHNRHIHQNLDDIQQAINVANRSFEFTIEQYQTLARRGVGSLDELRMFIREAFVGEVNAKAIKDVDSLREQKIINLFEAGRGSDIKGVQGTYWGAYNAVTEYLTYESKGGQEKRIESLWFSTNKGVAKRALQFALKRAA